MRSLALLTVAAATAVTALPHIQARQSDSNPFEGRQLYVNPSYSESLEQTRESFLEQGDAENAAKVRFVQERVGSFVWVPTISHLDAIDVAVANARAARNATGEEQVVGLVLYNLPDRDCSAGESAGELSLAENGLERYRLEFVDPFAQKVKEASDLTFAIVLEPDAVGNIVTNQGIEFCANAAEPHQDGIAYAVSQLQADNVALYIDASHGGWLGWDDNLAPSTFFFPPRSLPPSLRRFAQITAVPKLLN